MQSLPNGKGADNSHCRGGCAASVGYRCPGSTLRITFKGSRSLEFNLICPRFIGTPSP
jgi:hypothetical protein